MLAANSLFNPIQLARALKGEKCETLPHQKVNIEQTRNFYITIFYVEITGEHSSRGVWMRKVLVVLLLPILILTFELGWLLSKTSNKLNTFQLTCGIIKRKLLKWSEEKLLLQHSHPKKRIVLSENLWLPFSEVNMSGKAVLSRCIWGQKHDVYSKIIKLRGVFR